MSSCRATNAKTVRHIEWAVRLARAGKPVVLRVVQLISAGMVRAAHQCAGAA